MEVQANHGRMEVTARPTLINPNRTKVTVDRNPNPIEVKAIQNRMTATATPSRIGAVVNRHHIAVTVRRNRM